MAKESKFCKNARDLYEFMYQEEYPRIKDKLNQSKKLRMETARVTWKNIEEGYRQLLEEHGNVGVGKNIDGELVIRTGKPGKPPLLASKKKSKVTVGLDEKTTQDLEAYCEKRKLSKTDVIRTAIKQWIGQADESELLRL